MDTKKRYDIFVSYRRVGGFETAQLLSDRLTKLGYRVFFDLDTMRSGDFSEQIYGVIDHCKDVVVIVTTERVFWETENHTLESSLEIFMRAQK